MSNEHWHPWRAIRERPDIDVTFSSPAHPCARFRVDRVDITIDHRMTQATRRSVAAHELVHAERRIAHTEAVLRTREDAAVDAIAARRLIPLDRLADVLTWTANLDEAAEELWVHPNVVSVRIANLTDHERQTLNERINNG